jgi:hypothetical protein
MKKLTYLFKNYTIQSLLAVFILTIVTGSIIIYSVVINIPDEYNYEKIFIEMNKNNEIINKIGFVSSISSGNETVERKVYDNFIYKKIIVYGSKSKYALIEYWGKMGNTGWELDSLNILEISDNYIRK